MKVNEIILIYRNQLRDLYEEGELSQVIFLVFEHVKNFSKIDIHLRKDELLSDSEKIKLENILSELKLNMPVQYVLGYAWFSGMKFKVNEHVLIPRQETEELVEWISKKIEDEVRERKFDFNILDVCTGSGCIAIALKKKFPSANIFALDISEEALAVARENSKLNQAEVSFIQSDILRTPNFNLPTNYDLIVSNPPYVLESEKQILNKNVLDYEPHLALFVKDNDPLIFYNSISDFAFHHLKPGGKLYFEINEAKGKEVEDLLLMKGFFNVIVKKDLNEKVRMASAIK